MKDPNAKRVPVLLREFCTDIHEDGDLPSTFTNNKEAVCARAVCDYICTLTEAQAIDMYHRNNGSSSSSIFGTWF